MAEVGDRRNSGEEYFRRLIESGTPPDQAREIVAKTVAAKAATPATSADQPGLFDATPHRAPVPATIEAPKRKRGRPRKVNVPDTRSDAYINQLIDISLDVSERAAIDAEAIGFMPSIWACTTLPHSDLFDPVILAAYTEVYLKQGMDKADAKEAAKLKARLSQFNRSNGMSTLKIQADADYGLPYGRIPRVIMAWICTEAKREDSPHLLLGRNQTEFMRDKLKMPDITGGKNGSLTRVRDQVLRLATSRIYLFNNKENLTEYEQVRITARGMLLWNPKKPEERTLWDSTLTLSPEFFKIVQKAFPFDMRVVNALRSPLAIDIYLWMTWRLRRIRNGQTVVPWEALMLQFGSDYAQTEKGLHHFKDEFLRRLRDVMLYYTDAKVVPMAAGLWLRESPPHVPALAKPSF